LRFKLIKININT